MRVASSSDSLKKGLQQQRHMIVFAPKSPEKLRHIYANGPSEIRNLEAGEDPYLATLNPETSLNTNKSNIKERAHLRQTPV